MDAIFGRKNFRNEIIWCYTGPGSPGMRQFNRKHDVIFWYNKGQTWIFNRDNVRLPHKDGGPHAGGFKGTSKLANDPSYGQKGKIPETWWTNIAIAPRSKKQYLGYPTQKPLALLERIIKASSNPGDIVLDPFCGCGTTIHAAESLKRSWVGIDISTFATSLIRDRILKAFPQLSKANIAIYGVPETVSDAKALAQRDKFEFEKWVCGAIGAEGMFREPGTRGADGGVDGVLKFYRIHPDTKMRPEYAIVQVKGGHVTPDAVRALRTTIDRFEVTAGVLVCFEQYMRTVENQRSRDTFQDALGTYPVIQGYSVESLLKSKPLNLPLYGLKRQGASLTV